AFLCVALGLVPFAILPVLLRIGAQVAAAGEAGAELLDVLAAARTLSWLGAGLVATMVILWSLRAWMLAGRAVRRAPTWSCGFEAPTARMQYTASSFAAPLLDLFGGLSGSTAHRGGTRFHTVASDVVVTREEVQQW